ncbi:hypothetical protein [Actinokineospora sp.]|uniref:hypothetical protein n=1 Tax=Actinokineospora sp. TaxID=1872133 RepID=UPI0040378AE2
MDLVGLGGPVAAVLAALLSYLGARRMIRLEHAKEEARQHAQRRADEATRQQAAAALGEQARAAVVAERDQLLGRWQQTLDEAHEERRRLVEDHRVEIARVRKQSQWEVDRVRRETAAIIADLRAQVAERRTDSPGPSLS